MPIPSSNYMKLVGGLHSTNSDIYTSSKIRIGDTIKISGTASNNGIYAVTDVVSNANTGEGTGTTFTDDTRSADITSGTTMYMDGANTSLVAGLSVSGTNIQTDTYIASVTSTSDPATFEMSKSVGGTVSGGTTLTFGDMDIYYTLKGGAITDESSAGSTDPQIEVAGTAGDRMVALGDVDSALGIDVWSNNATTDYTGTSPASADGWTEAAINPTFNGSDAKYIYHFVDNALRVCNVNERNTSVVKWFGYKRTRQFNYERGISLNEWGEYPNSLSSPKLATSFTYAYGHTTHDGSDNAASYYQNNRGVARAKEDDVSDLRLDGNHDDSTTSFTFENTDNDDVLDQASAGEVITIGVALGAYPDEYLFCKKESGTGGGTITYQRAYGGALLGGAPASHSDHDTPILERGLGFNIAITDGTDDGDWEAGTYEFYQSFIYDFGGLQESLAVQMGNGASTIAAFTHTAAGDKSLRVSVFADLAYSGRIEGGRVYARLSGTDDDLMLVADIDMRKGVRTSLDGDHVGWTYDTDADDGFYVEGASTGNLSAPNLDTYSNINGFSPDVGYVAIGGVGELYKASTICNRRTFIANVKVLNKSGGLSRYGDRIMYSEIGKFDTFLDHNFIDVSKGDYGQYTALESYADRLLAFKHNLVHIINVSSVSIADWHLEETVKHYGVNFPFSVAKTNNGIAWASDDGCYLYDGRSVRNLLGRKIAVSKSSFGALDKNWQTWYRGSALVKDVMLGYDPISNSLIMMRSPNDSTTNSHESWVYDFDTDGWIYGDNVFTDSETYTNFIVDWNNNLALGYQNSSAVDFKKFLPVGIAQGNQRFFTKDIDFGQPGLTKKIYKVIVTYRSDTALSTPFQYAIDGKQNFSGAGGGTFTGDFIDTSSVWDVVTLTTTSPISCQSIQIKCNAFTASTGIFEINDMTIQYRTIGQKEAT